jgi:hypothetical protein
VRLHQTTHLKEKHDGKLKERVQVNDQDSTSSGSHNSNTGASRNNTEGIDGNSKNYWVSFYVIYESVKHSFTESQ